MIHLVQLLCPKRHCVLAAPFDPNQGGTFDAVVEQLKKYVETHALNPRCGLCDSRELTYEDGTTKFETMDEALPHFLENQAKQLLTREFLRKARN